MSVPVVIHDGIEAMRDCENCTLFKLLPNGALDKLVCLWVNCRCCLVQNEDARSSKQSTCQTDHLALTLAQISTALCDHHIETRFGFTVFAGLTSAVRLDEGFQVGQAQCFPHFGVGLCVEGVQVETQCTGEENRVLKIDRQVQVGRHSNLTYVFSD